MLTGQVFFQRLSKRLFAFQIGRLPKGNPLNVSIMPEKIWENGDEMTIISLNFVMFYEERADFHFRYI